MSTCFMFGSLIDSVGADGLMSVWSCATAINIRSDECLSSDTRMQITNSLNIGTGSVVVEVQI